MAPFFGDDAHGYEPDGYDDRPVPEMPEDLAWQLERDAAAYEAGEWLPSIEPPCCCEGVCDCWVHPRWLLQDRDAHGVPFSLADRFEQQFRGAQQQLAAAWRTVALMHQRVLAERGPLAAEHVGAELAVRMGVHPRTGTGVMITAIRAVTDIPRLAELVQAGCLSDRHVSAVLDEAGRWTDSEDQARLVIEQTLDRCAERAARYGWPTPGDLKRILQRVAILNDLRAAENKRKSVAERRGVSLMQTGAGAAMLTIEGPDLPLLLAHRAIAERAEAMKHLEGDTRSQQAREYDAACELLTLDAEMPAGGGISARPTTGLAGEPLELVVRGAHVAVVMPYSIAEGGELELAEVPGFGYLLPTTAKELLEHADTVQRVAVDASSGEVLAVDDAEPGPNRRRRPAWQAPASLPLDRRGEGRDPDGEPDGPSGSGGCGPSDSPQSPPPAPLGIHPAVAPEDPPAAVGVSLALLRELAHRKVIWRDLCTSSYRAPSRLRRFVEHRDRTCCFPGCTVPGRYCDVDHREEWPRGGTHAENCHVLCRRHHRAKQFYFADVTLDPTTGDTCWTTFEGAVYRRPPPRW